MRRREPKTDHHLVRSSRAGDAFHYRWAARRCLRLVDMRTHLRSIIIEGSKESDKPGEYGIDVAEYYESEPDGETIVYYQLKHSTVRAARDFVFSEFRSTLEHFGKRYTASFLNPRKRRKAGSVKFTFVTNRRIAESIKQGLAAIRAGQSTPIRPKFEAATQLKDEELRNFCAALSLIDTESNFEGQKEHLQGEMADYLVGHVEESHVAGLIALVTDQALPQSPLTKPKGQICREDVLLRLGVTTMRQLFPAPRKMEPLSTAIKREQHEALLSYLLENPLPLIIHAAGGVGKSVLARSLLESVPSGSWGLIYDCFGAGSYRNESELRHRACDALVQMANEMAVEGLCRPLVAQVNDSSTNLFRGFLNRITQAIETLRTANREAKLFILIDAADNAEMAAADLGGERCFAQALLRESIPDGCRLVVFCRTERVYLLRPQSTVRQYALSSFTAAETATHLSGFFPSASQADAFEFHRLTGGNPRVQANALSVPHQFLTGLLNRLGPEGTTVEDQIAAQLKSAISGLKDRHPATFAREIDSICLGLANLPPLIPLAVLANAAEVDAPTIESFVSDLGRPLWLSDDSVQFRDEQTETWFRQNFRGAKHQIETVIRGLEPLASKSTYAAKALPQLYHQAEKHQSLVALALSDNLLPDDNPIDARDIRVYRLQFAFKAALKLGRLADACRLAFRAGEEMAGDRRQMELLAKNIDLIPQLQSVQRVQELAYRHIFRSAWNGSENVYSAALLSSLGTLKGEARSYLRGAQRWLFMYFRERERQTDDRAMVDNLRDNDVVEFCWASLNLYGPADAAKFLLGWKPPEFIFRVGRLFIRRLVDASMFEQIDAISDIGMQQIYLILAIADELLDVARFPPKAAVERCLSLLANHNTPLAKGGRYHYEDCTTSAVISLCEAAAAQRIAKSVIMPVLQKYTATFADRSVGENHFPAPRRTFLRGTALRAVLNGVAEPSPESLIEKNDQGARPDDRDTWERDVKEAVGALMPWYFLRARLLTQDPTAVSVDLEHLHSRAKRALHGRYRPHDRIPYEVSAVRFQVLALKTNPTAHEMETFTTNIIHRADEKFYLTDRLPAVRCAFRLPHLHPLRNSLEQSCRISIERYTDERPEERADDYIALARAVLPESPKDAGAYLDYAIEAVSKFGDEIMERWAAVVAVASRAKEAKRPDAHLAYRFLRCAEVSGNSAFRESWDQNEVFRVAVSLHAPSAFAALSRWRDRAVGSFERQLRALATESLRQNLISASCGWGLTGFDGCNASAEYAILCASLEQAKSKKERILEIALRDLQLNEAKMADVRKLEEITSEFPSLKERIADIISRSPPAESNTPQIRGLLDHEQAYESVSIQRLLEEVDVLNTAALNRAVEAFHSIDPPGDRELFWARIVRLVPPGRAIEFLQGFVAVTDINCYEVACVIAAMQGSLREMASVRRYWKCFLIDIGKRFGSELAEAHRLSYLTIQGNLTSNDLEHVRTGMLECLADSSELYDATTFFGFICNTVSHLTPDEARSVLDYSIVRFEKHIASDFGDGEWSDWLIPYGDAIDAVAGLIWSALGSPYSATRWEAAHCVNRWAELGCEREITGLVRWMQSGEVGAFGSKCYPFYRLHAQLYLLIACARSCLDFPEMFRVHHILFRDLALEGVPHILINKNAANIALRVERASPGTYDAETVCRLRGVGVSPFPQRMVSRGDGVLDTPWHSAREVDLTLNVSFDWDFDAYWFPQLGRVFGLQNDQIEDLAREIAARILEIPSGERGDFVPDPRSQQWNSARYEERSTSHDHGSYPRNDTFQFYYSYHSFLYIASKLLLGVAVLDDPDGCHRGDRWTDWLSQHWITRLDGRWLADRRDPQPTRRRKWCSPAADEDWSCSIKREDFRDVLVNDSSSPGFLCVNGNWSYCEESRIEDISVQSALVNRETSESLANSLRSALDPYVFALPSYGHEHAEYRRNPFELVGWVKRSGRGDPRLDFFDPHAREIRYPPDGIGEEFEMLLGLSRDSESRVWKSRNSDDALIVNELWSDKQVGRRDVPSRNGKRMSASLELLKRLCVISGKDLIFCVEINRQTQYAYRSTSREHQYTPNSYKIFLLSYNGILRDARESHQLG